METGEFSPEDIHIPSIYVDRVVVGDSYEKRIEVTHIFGDNSFLYSKKSYRNRHMLSDTIESTEIHATLWQNETCEIG